MFSSSVLSELKGSLYSEAIDALATDMEHPFILENLKVSIFRYRRRIANHLVRHYSIIKCGRTLCRYPPSTWIEPYLVVVGIPLSVPFRTVEQLELCIGHIFMSPACLNHIWIYHKIIIQSYVWKSEVTATLNNQDLQLEYHFSGTIGRLQTLVPILDKIFSFERASSALSPHRFPHSSHVGFRTVGPIWKVAWGQFLRRSSQGICRSCT